MPYTKPEYRQLVDQQIESLGKQARDVLPPSKRKGHCNYVVTRFTLLVMKPIEGWDYTSISEAIAVLTDAAAEMRRRLLDPYEDKAIETNGDIPEYENPFEK